MTVARFGRRKAFYWPLTTVYRLLYKMHEQTSETFDRNAREALGLTQEALGERLGRHKDTIRAWESGKYEIDASASLALRLVVRLTKPRAHDIEAVRRCIPGKSFADAATAFREITDVVLDGLWRGA